MPYDADLFDFSRSLPFVRVDRPVEAVPDQPLSYGRDPNSRTTFAGKINTLSGLNWSMPRLKRQLQFRNLEGDSLLVAHFQGMSMDRHWPAVATFRDATISVPDNVTIVTFATANILGTAMLTQQLWRTRIPYLNAAAHLKHLADWDNTKKSALLLRALPKVTTEYTLVLDALDVLLCGPLDTIVERFHRYNKRVLFGASKAPWPKVPLQTDEGLPAYGDYGYLNAGTTFGRTKDLVPFFRQAADMVEVLRGDADDYRNRSEQLIIRSTYAKNMRTVGIDWRCSVFQTFGQADPQQDGDMVTLY